MAAAKPQLTWEVVGGDINAHIFVKSASLCGTWTRPVMAHFVRVGTDEDSHCGKCERKLLTNYGRLS